MRHYVENLSGLMRDFALTEEQFKQKVLLFPNGISTALLDLRKMNIKNQWIAADPRYNLKADELQRKTSELVNNSNLSIFIEDYQKQYPRGYYQPATLPQLPFKHFEFQLALCPFLVFEAHHSVSAQLEIIAELCRVATEVRIYPLPDPDRINNTLGPLLLQLQTQHFNVQIEALKNVEPSAALLRLSLNECKV